MDHTIQVNDSCRLKMKILFHRFLEKRTAMGHCVSAPWFLLSLSFCVQRWLELHGHLILESLSPHPHIIWPSPSLYSKKKVFLFGYKMKDQSTVYVRAGSQNGVLPSSMVARIETDEWGETTCWTAFIWKLGLWVFNLRFYSRARICEASVTKRGANGRAPLRLTQACQNTEVTDWESGFCGGCAESPEKVLMALLPEGSEKQVTAKIPSLPVMGNSPCL